MKKFTVKDFILYNSPCLNCDKPISLKLGHVERNNFSPVTNTFTTLNKINPIDNSLQINLKSTYFSVMQTLTIDYKTNKFSCNLNYLKDYLQRYNMFLDSKCDICLTTISSDFLNFNFERYYLEPLTLSKETIIINENNKIYTIFSSFIEEKSLISISNISTRSQMTKVIPILPRHKFKNKQHCLSKLKTYELFS